MLSGLLYQLSYQPIPFWPESSGGYYALLKRGGKQFRRSLKTKDRKLAERSRAIAKSPNMAT
jgi:hypothetical protein